MVAVGAILKHNPYAWLALDTSIPREEKSQRIPKPEDLVGKTVGVQAGAEFHVDFIIGRCGLPPDSVRAMKVGFSLDVLILGAVDFYGGMDCQSAPIAGGEGVLQLDEFSLSAIRYG